MSGEYKDLNDSMDVIKSALEEIKKRYNINTDEKENTDE